MHKYDFSFFFFGDCFPIVKEEISAALSSETIEQEFFRNFCKTTECFTDKDELLKNNRLPDKPFDWQLKIKALVKTDLSGTSRDVFSKTSTTTFQKQLSGKPRRPY